ncbi:MAG TPA: hypothetical protein DDZ96_07040 [Porphyromonadaceae bacterium]|jgi:CDP-diglyceride synthetase|uniref:hypothetical protein n=1 Tax=Limibacterium fermenti TaxID=3229863 RepID=UPI000E91C7F0|nr:hypothetical protein [Porphyromonadaceae bacterium]HBL33558.1 hypothetical protein [Porphyromonadaceae bacterium]HBX45703.1 hypothetical protein [Porphyromonadaceae bacterium]HCM19302.1 hypothetical protein [Porphyromonadaceae bacterium]
MKKLAAHLFIVHTLALVVVGYGAWEIINRFFPQILIDGYVIIPLFFFVTGVILIYLMMKIPKDKPKQLVNTYMLLRVVKVFAALILVLIYWFADKAQIRNFAIIFIIFYLIYLMIETYIYIKIEMYLKKQGEGGQSSSETNKPEQQ